MHRVRCAGAVLGLTLALPLVSSAQAPEGELPIVVEKKFLGEAYTYNGQNLKVGLFSFGVFKDIMVNNPEAVGKVQKAQGYYVPAFLTSVLGGTMIGWPIGRAIGGADDPNWALAAVGGGVAVLSLVLAKASGNQLKQAVDLYNSGINNPMGALRPSPLELALAPNAMAVRLRF